MAVKEEEIKEFVHDAKIVLTSIRGYAELIQMDSEGGLKEHAEGIVRGVDLLENLLESLLRVSKGVVSEVDVDLCSLVESVVDVMKGDFSKKGRKIEFDCEDVVFKTDPDLLFRVLLNILQNSLRHGEGNVRVRVGNGIIAIADGGKWRGGKGLGMSIVEKMLKMLGGRLKIRETEDGKEMEISLGV